MQHDQIKGFTDQSQSNMDLVNRNKDIEERTRRIIDDLRTNPNIEQGFVTDAERYIVIGFMLLNRAIFKPQRIELPEDAEPAPEITEPSVYVGKVFQDMERHQATDDKGNELLAVGHHWYVKHEWENYQRRLKGEPEVPRVPATPASDIETHED